MRSAGLSRRSWGRGDDGGTPPDRDGWVTGPLAKLPPCPPFPDFTDFEVRVLDCLAALFGKDEAAFREQVAVAKVVDRINTIHGFYTRVAIDRAACRPLEVQYKGGSFDIEGFEHGLGVVLWDEDGYLSQIEGFGYSSDMFADIDLAKLRFAKLIQLGWPVR